MITTLVIKCDWPGCRATESFEFRTLEPPAGWKAEGLHVYALHLCPEHRRKTWHAVRLAQVAALPPRHSN